MNKKTTTNMGPHLKNIRTARKISRKDLASICHPNTLRNFEVGFNQINIDDFTKLLIELGYTDYDINDSLETIEGHQYDEYITICSEYDFFKVQCQKESLKTDEQALNLYQNTQKYLKSDDFVNLNLVFQQDLYAKYVDLGNYLQLSTVEIFQQGLDMFHQTYQKGQKNYSQGEINLMSALCAIPCKKENSFYKICDKICEIVIELSYLKKKDYEFLYNYIELLYTENYRKFNTLKAKIADKNKNIMNIFYDVKKS